MAIEFRVTIDVALKTAEQDAIKYLWQMLTEKAPELRAVMERPELKMFVINNQTKISFSWPGEDHGQTAFAAYLLGLCVTKVHYMQKGK